MGRPSKYPDELRERAVRMLSQMDRESLTPLLGETTMSGIIKAASVVTGRNKFLAGLERLTFPSQGTDTIGERDHLHPDAGARALGSARPTTS